MNLDALTQLAEAHASGDGLPPVDAWAPAYEAEMDLIIRRDGTWWHEGGLIKREALVKLFSTILRKDEDGRTYLVTPAEKLGIQVERAHFLAVRLDVQGQRQGQGRDQRLFFTTNMGDVVELGPDNPLRVETDKLSREPVPLLRVRGRLDALLTRAVFFELADLAVEQNDRYGVWAAGHFFELGAITDG